MPGSPTFGTADRIELSLGDVMIRDGLGASRDDSPHRMMGDIDILSDMEGMGDNRPDMGRRMATGAEQDLGDDDTQSQAHEHRQYRTRRRRGQWPDLSVLEEWSHMEKEDRTEERRVKRITEPQLINGRLRPVRKGWYQTDEESPYLRLSPNWFSLVVASGNFLFQILGFYPTTNQMKTTWNRHLFQQACAIIAPLQRVTPKFTRASHRCRLFMITRTCAKGLRHRSGILLPMLLQEANLDVLHLLGGSLPMKVFTFLRTLQANQRKGLSGTEKDQSGGLMSSAQRSLR
ncbi:hypothetical protein LB503_000687 [Fusarium chuoi]|nr:hypothetical protein LB503_000687 [Fusarium chuoi]